MFSSAGLSGRDEITADDFLRLFGQHQEALGYAQLQVAGGRAPPPTAARLEVPIGIRDLGIPKLSECRFGIRTDNS